MKTLKPNKKGITRLGAFVPSLLRFCAFSSLFFYVSVPLYPVTASAEVPTKFTYQGNLRQAGFLVNGTRNMVFRIYDSSAAVNPLWTSAVSSVQISTGVFRATLEPVIADWETGSLWLELEVEGTKLTPREELTSSPYAVNSLMISGKKYTTASSAPTGAGAGDLWMDTVSGNLKFWNGTSWAGTSGIAGAHASTHGAGGSDPILNLGTHTVTGAITFDSVGELRAAGGVFAVTIATNAVVQGTLNPASNLMVGGAGYSVAFSSSVNAGWFYGNGSGLTDLNASNISTGEMNGDRIADNSISRLKLSQSGCADGNVLQWSGTQWVCSLGGGSDNLGNHTATTVLNMSGFQISSAGAITASSFTATGMGVGAARLRLADNVVISSEARAAFGGGVNISSNVYIVGFSSAARYYGDGSGLTNLNGQNITDRSITSGKLGDSGCTLGQVLTWNSISGNWQCSDLVNGGERDPLSIHNQNFLQPNAGFYVSSGTVNYLTVNNQLDVFGPAHLRGSANPLVVGLNVDTMGNVGIGSTGLANTRLEIKSEPNQAYSVTVSTGAARQMVLTTAGDMGVGTETPNARMEVTGSEAPGGYIMIFNSGTKIAAWLRNK